MIQQGSNLPPSIRIEQHRHESEPEPHQQLLHRQHHHVQLPPPPLPEQDQVCHIQSHTPGRQEPSGIHTKFADTDQPRREMVDSDVCFLRHDYADIHPLPIDIYVGGVKYAPPFSLQKESSFFQDPPKMSFVNDVLFSTPADVYPNTANNTHAHLPNTGLSYPTSNLDFRLSGTSYPGTSSRVDMRPSTVQLRQEGSDTSGSQYIPGFSRCESLLANFSLAKQVREGSGVDDGAQRRGGSLPSSGMPTVGSVPSSGMPTVGSVPSSGMPTVLHEAMRSIVGTDTLNRVPGLHFSVQGPPTDLPEPSSKQFDTQRIPEVSADLPRITQLYGAQGHGYSQSFNPDLTFTPESLSLNSTLYDNDHQLLEDIMRPPLTQSRAARQSNATYHQTYPCFPGNTEINQLLYPGNGAAYRGWEQGGGKPASLHPRQRVDWQGTRPHQLHQGHYAEDGGWLSGVAGAAGAAWGNTVRDKDLEGRTDIMSRDGEVDDSGLLEQLFTRPGLRVAPHYS